MNCKECEEILVINMFGKLSQDEKERLDSHIQACPECARKFDKMPLVKDAFDGSEDVPLPDRERSWEIIADRALKSRRGFQMHIPFSRAAWIASALVAVFVLGFFFGRQFIFEPSARPSGPLLAEQRGTPLERYAEGLETVLVGFMNRGVPHSEELAGLEKLLIDEMLIQTKILKRLFQDRNDPILELLEDMELILVALSNLSPEDSLGAEQLHGLIKEKGLKLRLRVLSDSKAVL